MTSVASLILKLTSLTRQSQFYLSQYLGALIHLPNAWRNLHADLHLTSLTLRVLQLSRQLRLDSLIRIGVPPLLKLTSQPARLKPGSETEMDSAIIPLDLFELQKPLTNLQETILNAPNPFQAITHTLLQTSPSTTRPVAAGRITPVAKETISSTMTSSTRQRLPTSARLTDETPAEETLRENVVETWLLRQDETGRRPKMSFVEAHKLYRDLFEEFVATSILPPNLFTDRFLQTPPDLTYEQAKTDLLARLTASPSEQYKTSDLKNQTQGRTQITSILLPSYITNSLWAKGSLAFGVPQSMNPRTLRLTPNNSEVSSRSTPSPFSEIVRDDQPQTPPLMESNSSPSYSIHEESKNDIPQRDTVDLLPEISSIDTQASKLLPKEESLGDGTQPKREDARGGPITNDYRIIGLTNRKVKDSRIYSPAAALYTTLAAHTTTAFISSTLGNGHTSPPTIHTSPLKPPFAIVRNLKTVTFSDITPSLTLHEEPVIERLERILPIVESHPTPIYLRPPMNLPAVENMGHQRTPASTLPSSNIAPTRENLSKEDLDRSDEAEEDGEPEGYPETEDDEADAAMREQVKRFGKIIAEEARRHIGST